MFHYLVVKKCGLSSQYFEHLDYIAGVFKRWKRRETAESEPIMSKLRVFLNVYAQHWGVDEKFIVRK